MKLTKQLEELAARLSNLAGDIEKMEELKDLVSTLSANADGLVDDLEELSDGIRNCISAAEDLRGEADEAWEELDAMSEKFNGEEE